MLDKSITNILSQKSYRWIVTGGAGFIGSHIVRYLLSQNQKVIVVDNLLTGKEENISFEELETDNYSNLKFYNESIENLSFLNCIMKGVDFVFHQAALGSVPKSIEFPELNNSINITGTLNILKSASENKVKRVVMASSSAVYGDNFSGSLSENQIGVPLSPYALSKIVGESYGKLFSELYHLNVTGLRYFNVFGPRQDPNGNYAAVIPKWMESLLSGEDLFIFGDGSQTRDFCYVADVVEANIRAALNKKSESWQLYNVASGDVIKISQLAEEILNLKNESQSKIINKTERAGDIKHSKANIQKAKCHLGFVAQTDFKAALEKTFEWYEKKHPEVVKRAS